jgi:hypothetical protein
VVLCLREKLGGTFLTVEDAVLSARLDYDEYKEFRRNGTFKE